MNQSSVLIDSLNNAANQIKLYGYSIMFIAGLIGNTLNILIFTIKSKGNPCSLYLLAAQVSDILVLLLFLLPSIVYFITGKDGTESLSLWCKLNPYVANYLSLTSAGLLCLASIDRYHFTSRDVQRRGRSSMRIAKVSIVCCLCLAIFPPLPDIIYHNLNKEYHICMVSALLYYYYTVCFIGIFLQTFLPVTLLSTFGWLTYRNLKRVTTAQRRTTPATRKQHVNAYLTRILVSQILCFLLSTLSVFPYNLYVTITLEWQKTSLRRAIENLVSALVYVTAFTYTSSNFYIYCLASAVFRSNVKSMLGSVRNSLRRTTTVTPTQ